MGTKLCVGCGTSKPAARFFPSVATEDGRRPRCIACYFVRNGGRAPKGFVYEASPTTVKVWITHGSLPQNQSGRITITEGTIEPENPAVLHTIASCWGEEGSMYYKPDWHLSEAEARAEIQRLATELVQARRAEFLDACRLRDALAAGTGLLFEER
jgi:hypothetical protein